jgi:catechol 2,3-dioxygenase-like lactoylglutathione lyase family enzyme
MKSSLSHLQINISSQNVGFYKELFALLGWPITFEEPQMVAFGSFADLSIWFMEGQKNEEGDYDKKGVNHLGFKVEKQRDVDEVVKFLETKNIRALFETPRHRPEFAASEHDTYYQVMFTSPDNILFEVMYTGQKL